MAQKALQTQSDAPFLPTFMSPSPILIVHMFIDISSRKKPAMKPPPGSPQGLSLLGPRTPKSPLNKPCPKDHHHLRSPMSRRFIARGVANQKKGWKSNQRLLLDGCWCWNQLVLAHKIRKSALNSLGSAHLNQGLELESFKFWLLLYLY